MSSFMLALLFFVALASNWLDLYFLLFFNWALMAHDKRIVHPKIINIVSASGYI